MTNKRRDILAGALMALAFALGWSLGRESGSNEIKAEVTPLLKQCVDIAETCLPLLEPGATFKAPSADTLTL